MPNCCSGVSINNETVVSIKIYHNPRCRKSRETLDLLRSKGIDPEIREYLKHPLGVAELTEILEQLKLSAKDLVRKSEQIYKDHYKNKMLTEAQWIQAMVDNPKLIERPIVVADKKAAIGRPPENVLEIL